MCILRFCSSASTRMASKRPIPLPNSTPFPHLSRRRYFVRSHDLASTQPHPTIHRQTHARFWGSVLFSDHYSDLIHNHLITGPTSEQTLASKHAYERFADGFGVSVREYRADNSRFNDNNFRGSCVASNQKLSFCAVGTYHQNGIAEAKLKQVCYGARTILLHAMRKWPSVITTALWPFAMQAIVDRYNHLSLDEHGKSPIEKFSGIPHDIDVSAFRTFGCPVFILDAANQSGMGGTPKW